VLICVPEISAQEQRTYPAFTMTVRTTAYDASGHAISSSIATRYDSGNGDWRYVRNVAGYEIATLYRRGRGVYYADSRTQLTLKMSAQAPGCPLRNAEQLRGDPKFIRTENILGFDAYFLRERFSRGDLVMETSFVPELGGGIPFKRVYTYDDGRRIVEEPVALVMGEPRAADLSGPDYRVIDQLPVFDKELESKTLSQPAPVFPADADTAGFGNTVFVSVIIDEDGRVLNATANSSITFLDDPAIAAAYQATFKPPTCNGRPVKATGILRYKFVSPHLAKN
jgi:TonB family protein